MNTDVEYANEVRGTGEDMLSPKRPLHMGRRNPNIKLQRVVGLAIMAVEVLILLFVLLLVILPFFKVKQIKVVGNSHYAAEEIIAASGIEIGTESPGVDVQKAANALLTSSPYIQSCKISVFPFSVRITVVEKPNVMYTYIENKDLYVSFEYLAEEDRFLVLETEKGEAGRMEAFRFVQLPQISSAKVGGYISFTRENLDMTYVTQVIEALEWYGIYGDVVALDFSSRANLCYQLESGCTVKLGTLDDLDEKIAKAMTLIRQNEGAIEADVRDLQKTTVRLP